MNPQPRGPVTNNAHDPGGRYRYVLLWLATAAATYQIYFLPALGTYFPAALLLAYAGLLMLRIRQTDVDIAWVFVCYAAIVAVSGAWSSDRGAWANGIAYGFLFYCAFFTARSFTDGGVIARVLNGFLVFALVNGVMVIVFRLSPAIEGAFFDSPLRALFMNPKLLANLDLFLPNTTDPDKAGGIFPNANTGAAFSLLCTGVTVATWSTRGGLRNAVYLGVFSLAVLMSGSKSAVMIYAAAMSAVIFARALRVPNAYMRLALMSMTGMLAVGAALAALLLSDSIGSSDFGQDVSQTSEYRMLLWRVARLEFWQHPLLGLGFGGWGDVLGGYVATGIKSEWPPHNSLVAAWAESGILAPILLAIVWLKVFGRLLRRVAQDADRGPALGALFGLVCVAAMSMGDTFPLFGNQYMAFPLGVLVAWGISDRPLLVPQAASTPEGIPLARFMRGAA